MSNDVVKFLFNDQPVRTLVVDNDPWFVASDVATVLGYSNPWKAVGDHCKAAQRITLTKREGQRGGAQFMTAIPERDVYRLVMRSKLPQAEEFEEWVVGTVIPSIRNDGAYVMGEEKVKTGELDEAQFLLQAFEMLQSKVDRLTVEREQLKASVAELEPKGEFYDNYGQSQGYKTTREVKHLTRFKERALFQRLYEDGVMHKSLASKTWVPTARFQNSGYFHVRTFQHDHGISSQTYWTPKGIQWLVSKYGRHLEDAA